MELPEIHRALKACDVLATADDDALEWLAENAKTHEFGPDQIVFEAGEPSSRVYVVASGSLQVRLGETAKLVSFAEAGALFGEYAMFVKGVRTAHVIAAESSTLLSFEEAPFREFLLRYPTVMMQILQTAVRRLHRIERKRS
jgi:CRP/FNR family transcriptional regulator, cyclic AMP receptor protein